jgi:Flp pilus assembly protein TadG
MWRIILELFERLRATGAAFGKTATNICQAWLLRSLRDTRGGSAILVALGAPAIVGGLVLSIDVGLWYLEKRRLQQIADTARLGAVQVLRSGGSQEAAKNAALSDAKRNGYAADGRSTLTVNMPPAEGPYAGDPNAVEVIATRKLALLFSGYFMADGPTIQARSVAEHSAKGASAPRRNLEVVMMLDVSSSMAGPSELLGLTKLQAMHEAARKVVDAVVQSNQEPFTTRVAIVPYGSAVSVGTAHVKAVTGTTSSNRSAVVERTGTAAFTDDAPGPGRYFPDYKPLSDALKGDKLTLEVLPQLREGPALTPPVLRMGRPA